MTEGQTIWCVEVTVPRDAVDAVETALATDALAVTSFESPEPDDWQVRALFSHTPERSALEARLSLATAATGGAPPALIAPLPDIDWVAESQRQLAPMRIGRFHIHGSHDAPANSPALIDLTIDAGRAFGTGRHESTQGCLLALAALARRQRFGNILDMGCGSGVLSLAAARLWRDADITAADMDPDSVAATLENARINRLSRHIRAIRCDGFHSRKIGSGRPYDLILANILARPLASMAGDLGRHLAPGGVTVLSGLLKTQEALVLAAYRNQGIKLQRRIELGEWHTLILAKGRAEGGPESREVRRRSAAR
jgi:ribosomal protein L11 methyltransferase